MEESKTFDSFMMLVDRLTDVEQRLASASQALVRSEERESLRAQRGVCAFNPGGDDADATTDFFEPLLRAPGGRLVPLGDTRVIVEQWPTKTGVDLDEQKYVLVRPNYALNRVSISVPLAVLGIDPYEGEMKKNEGPPRVHDALTGRGERCADHRATYDSECGVCKRTGVFVELADEFRCRVPPVHFSADYTPTEAHIHFDLESRHPEPWDEFLGFVMRASPAGVHWGNGDSIEEYSTINVHIDDPRKRGFFTEETLFA